MGELWLIYTVMVELSSVVSFVVLVHYRKECLVHGVGHGVAVPYVVNGEFAVVGHTFSAYHNDAVFVDGHSC